ncbi:hypothetical protein V1512DRAFT_246930 [Lipomyces arxii]|uniref:uncharacterized protein n=1 Tax=Lipomyces arxii TaxID=56418 RepID=UPI0034CD90EF
MSSTKEEPTKRVLEGELEDDDKPDPWDKRLEDTGCAAENMKVTDCYANGRDWRKCVEELAALKECLEKKIKR